MSVFIIFCKIINISSYDVFDDEIAKSKLLINVLRSVNNELYLIFLWLIINLHFLNFKSILFNLILNLQFSFDYSSFLTFKCCCCFYIKLRCLSSIWFFSWRSFILEFKSLISLFWWLFLCLYLFYSIFNIL